MESILVVDDEPEVIEMLRKNLELEGYEVEGAPGKEAAVEKMEAELYSLVVLDIKFPETSGMELLAEFKDINPLVNVVILTGYSSMENVVSLIEGGAVDYFTKPLDMDLFLEVIEQLDTKIDRWRESIGMS